MTCFSSKMEFWKFISEVSNVKVFPNEECFKQHHILVCDFSTHIPRAKKCMSHPVSEPGGSGTQLQLASSSRPLRLKMMTATDAVATASGADADTANRIDLFHNNFSPSG